MSETQATPAQITYLSDLIAKIDAKRNEMPAKATDAQRAQGVRIFDHVTAALRAKLDGLTPAAASKMIDGLKGATLRDAISVLGLSPDDLRKL